MLVRVGSGAKAAALRGIVTRLGSGALLEISSAISRASGRSASLPRASPRASESFTCSSTTRACCRRRGSAPRRLRAHGDQRARAVPAHPPAARSPAPRRRCARDQRLLRRHVHGRLDADDPQLEAREFDGPAFYAHTKRADVVLTELWARDPAAAGLSFYSMHPGWADTPGLSRSLPRFHRLTRPLLRDIRPGGGHDRLARHLARSGDALRGALARPPPAAQAPRPLHARVRRRARALLVPMRAANRARVPRPCGDESLSAARSPLSAQQRRGGHGKNALVRAT